MVNPAGNVISQCFCHVPFLSCGPWSMIFSFNQFFYTRVHKITWLTFLCSFFLQLWFCICWCWEENESGVFWIAITTGKVHVMIKAEFPLSIPRISWFFLANFLLKVSAVVCKNSVFLQVRVDGVIVVDNVLWHGKVADPLVNYCSWAIEPIPINWLTSDGVCFFKQINDAKTASIRSFNKNIMEDPRVSISMVCIWNLCIIF